MIEVNLIAKKKKARSTIVMGVDISAINFKMLILVGIIYYICDLTVGPYFQAEEEKVQSTVSKAQTELTKLKAELRTHGSVKDRLKLYERRIKELEKRTVYVGKILKMRTNPQKVLEKIAKSVPDDMWFEKLDITKERQIIISGKAEEYKTIGDFLAFANDSAFFGRSLTLANSQTVDETLYGKKRRVEVFEIKGKIETFDPWQGNN